MQAQRHPWGSSSPAKRPIRACPKRLRPSSRRVNVGANSFLLRYGGLMFRPRTLVQVGMVAAATLVAVGSVAAAAPAGPSHSVQSSGGSRPRGEGWHRYRTAPFTDPAGDPCSFKVRVTVVRDHEWYRTLSRYRSHKPFVQEYTGPLYMRYRNVSTGTSVVRNLSGTAFFTFGSDGSLVVPWHGGGGITSHPGNTGLKPGEWVFSGTYILREDKDGNKHVRQFSGTRENLCKTLAAS
jgi:hypothetical protein